jgi:hypothetical protein
MGGRRRFPVASVVATILLAMLAAAPAGSSSLRCRSDPSILLSDGTVIDVSADIDAALWDVEKVSYTLHVPIGLRIVAVVRTPDWPTTVEQFELAADRLPGRFDAVTRVVTAEPAAVTANQVVVRLLSAGVASTEGKSGRNLATTVFAP